MSKDKELEVLRLFYKVVESALCEWGMEAASNFVYYVDGARAMVQEMKEAADGQEW